MHITLSLLLLFVQLASQSIGRPRLLEIDHLYWCRSPALEPPTINKEVQKGICVAGDCEATIIQTRLGGLWYPQRSGSQVRPNDDARGYHKDQESPCCLEPGAPWNRHAASLVPYRPQDAAEVARPQGDQTVTDSVLGLGIRQVRAVLEQPCLTGGRTGTVRPKHLPAGRTGLSDQFLGPVAQDQPGPVGQICPTSWLSLRSDSVRPTTGRTRLFEHCSSSRVRPVNAGSGGVFKSCIWL
ncbi:hypothetical protein PCASD_03711 [Puccinia coronata f. sp. avenae]|uniref:Uncharacterized protein n=1 Tax=Puccinia coronata f. sp. avenae TaxID=200324 RepID=A0A2N5V9M8_9BASI|nr:hypothetical protein PCASD_03711 [Puccinia coronata f. sp. avenae]